MCISALYTTKPKIDSKFVLHFYFQLIIKQLENGSSIYGCKL